MTHGYAYCTLACVSMSHAAPVGKFYHTYHTGIIRDRVSVSVRADFRHSVHTGISGPDSDWPPPQQPVCACRADLSALKLKTTRE